MPTAFVPRVARTVAWAALACISSPTFAQPPEFEWSRRFGGTLNDVARAVAVDGQGSVLVTGDFGGSVDFDGFPLTSQGSSDVYLVKLDALGDVAWALGFGSAGTDGGRGVAVDPSGHVFLLGSFSGTVDFGGDPLISAGSTDVFVASFDASGAHRWSKRFGSTGTDTGVDVAVGPDASITAVGTFFGSVDFGGGPFPDSACLKAFVARYDGMGLYLWSAQRRGACDANFESSYQSSSVAVDSDGHAHVAVRFAHCITDCFVDAFVQEYDAAGDSVAITPALELDETVISGVAVDGDGHVYATMQGVDVNEWRWQNVATWSSGQDQTWFYTYHQTTTLAFNSIALDPGGDALVVGRFGQTVDFGDGVLVSEGGNDMCALRLAADGSAPQSVRIGGIGNDEATSVATAGPGAVVSAGLFSNTIAVGIDSHTSAGGTDILVAKLRYSDFVSVAIAEFHAQANGGVVELRAGFRSNLGVESVNVYRSAAGSVLRRIASVHSVGADAFQFVDRDVLPGREYRYQIGVVDADGEFFSVVATVTVPVIAEELGQNRPNPFNPQTTIRFVIDEREHVSLTIFDAAGRRVRTLLDEERSHGAHEVTWDGRDNAGQPVGSGVYFYRLVAGTFSESRKMSLLK